MTGYKVWYHAGIHAVSAEHAIDRIAEATGVSREELGAVVVDDLVYVQRLYYDLPPDRYESYRPVKPEAQP